MAKYKRMRKMAKYKRMRKIRLEKSFYESRIRQENKGKKIFQYLNQHFFFYLLYPDRKKERLAALNQVKVNSLNLII